MRKWLWGCSAVVLAGAGWLGWYTHQHPDSFLGRCAHDAGVLSLRCNPLLAFHGHLFQPAPAGSVQTPGEVSDVEALLADPIPLEALPGEPADQKLIAWAELPDINPPGGPAPIVIQEEEPFPVPGENGTVQAEELPKDIDIELLPPGPNCPRQMPYCNDDEARPERMPRADQELGEDEPSYPEEQKEAPLASWLEIFFGSQLNTTGGSAEEAEPPLTHPAADSSLAPRPRPSCPSMDSHSGCPSYHGPCSSPSTTQPAAESEEQESGTKTTPHTRGRQPRLPPSFRQALFEDGGLAEPKVDTMEYRSSDRTLGDYGNNPY